LAISEAMWCFVWMRGRSEFQDLRQNEQKKSERKKQNKV